MAPRIIEALARISATDNTGKAFDSVKAKIGALEKAHKFHSKGIMTAVDNAARALTDFQNKTASVTAFRALHGDMVKARQEFRGAETNVRSLASAMAATAAPTAAMSREFKRAQRDVKASSAAYLEKASAVKAARREMEQHGVTLRNIQKTEAEISRGHRPAGAYGGGGVHILPTGGIPKGVRPALGAGAVAYGVKKTDQTIREQHHEAQFEYKYQQGILGINAEQQKPLMEQANKIGIDTRFTHADVIRAQTDIGGKLPRELQNTGTISAITEASKDYALAMKVSLTEGAEAIISAIKTQGYDISTPETAGERATHSANRLVTLAKTSGAKHHDLVNILKFGGATSRTAGISEAVADAISAQLARVGYDGAMAGTFGRSSALRLVSPTQKAQAGIASMGLNFDDYVTPGTDLSAGGLNKILKQRFGRGVSAAGKKKLQEIFNNEELRGDQASFVSAVSDALNGTFARKGKNGKVNAQESERIAKAINDFFILSAKSVNVEKLLLDILGKGLTPAQAKSIFGIETGGRALTLNRQQLERDIENNKNIKPDTAKQIANKNQEGAQGEYTKMIGSMQAFGFAVGEATDGLRSLAYKGVGSIFDVLAKSVKGEELARTPTSLNTQTKDGWRVNQDAALERSRREQREIEKYPELRRGNGFNTLSANRKMEATIKPDQIISRVEQPVPVDVTGKVQMDPSSRAQINVNVKVTGPGQVTGTSASSSGNVSANIGTSSAE